MNLMCSHWEGSGLMRINPKTLIDKMIINFCREPKSVMEIMDNFKFKSRTSFKRNYLQRMLAEGTLKMTIPDKPSIQ